MEYKNERVKRMRNSEVTHSDQATQKHTGMNECIQEKFVTSFRW